MLLLAVVPILAAIATLAWVRRRSDGEATGKRLRVAAWIASGVVSGGLALGVFEALPYVWGYAPKPAPGWATYAHIGAVLGTTMYIVMRLVLFGATTALHRWSCRLPREHEITLGRRLLVEAAVLAGFVGTLTVVMTLAFFAGRANLPTWLVLPVAAAIFPLYQSVVVPWVEYSRAPRLSSRDLTDLQEWLDDLRVDRGLPPFAVRVQEGRLANAFAAAGLGPHLVVIGGRLLDRLTRSELRAVLAHEIAHVELRHVPRRVLPLAVVASMLYLACIFSLVNPLLDKQELPFVLAGVALVGVLAAVFHGILPGFFMRRMEFEADRLAVRMLGDATPLANALTKLNELHGRPLDAKSVFHPPTQARLDAIHALPIRAN